MITDCRISGTTALGTASRKSPVGRCPRSRAAAPAAASSSKAGLARDRKRSPAWVRPTLRVVRMKSATPMRASSARTAWLIADGVTPSSAAALRKLRCRAKLRDASKPSSAPCLTVKFCFIPRRHYLEWSIAGSGPTSALQIRSHADVETQDPRQAPEALGEAGNRLNRAQDDLGHLVLP